MHLISCARGVPLSHTLRVKLIFVAALAASDSDLRASISKSARQSKADSHYDHEGAVPPIRLTFLCDPKSHFRRFGKFSGYSRVLKVGFSLKSMNLNFPPKLNLELSITEKRYKTFLLKRNVAI